MKLRGIVSRITFQKEDTGFTVLRLQDEKDSTVHTCVGVMPTIEAGESVEVRGEWERSARYGLQFNVQGYEFIRPTTIEGIKNFLGAGIFPNIGPVRAQNIVDTFGIETLEVLDSAPQRLIEVAGIGEKRVQAIVQSWQKQHYIKELMLFIQQFGVTVAFVYKIYKAYGERAKEIICADPYALINDIPGIGFKKADSIAHHLGFKTDSYRRIRAGIQYCLHDAAGEGHVYFPRKELIEKTAALLQVTEERVIYSLDHILNEKILIEEEQRVYLPSYFHAETAVAAMIGKRIQYQQRFTSSFSESMVNTWLTTYISSKKWQADPKQILAVKAAIDNKIVLITGGPGTGKTTTLQVIVSFFQNHNYHITLTAPTGRAAQRMGSIAGISAQTIHRLLEYTPRSEGKPFGRHEQNPIPTDVLICDEVSMIDLLLLKSLIAAVKNDTTIVLVGDNNQLPSVGAGNVLSDLIDSCLIPHIVLTTIFRQSQSSRIVTAAHQIINGQVPKLLNAHTDNCFFMQRNDPQECLDTLIDLVYTRLPKRYNLDPTNDIQVLSPMHKGILGTQRINAELQKRLNNSETSLCYGERTLRVGDKVMQIKNNYDSGIFNGDTGIVVRITEQRGVLVDFNNTVVPYEYSDLDQLVQAYCISIHKSQGSEFEAVVIPVVTQHYVMLQRNLIYTALTRAKKLCIFVGTKRAFAIAVTNDKALNRYTALTQRLKAL